MREYTEVMADEMTAEMTAERVVEQVQDTCGQVQDTCGQVPDTCEQAQDTCEQVQGTCGQDDIKAIYYAVKKHGLKIEPGDDAYFSLVRCLKIGTYEERARAIEVLGHIEDTYALWMLHDVARDDPNHKLRARALEIACARFGAHALVLDAVFTALLDSPPIVRFAAGQLILDLYRNANPAVRQRILEYLVCSLSRLI